MKIQCNLVFSKKKSTYDGLAAIYDFGALRLFNSNIYKNILKKCLKTIWVYVSIKVKTPSTPFLIFLSYARNFSKSYF
jgi:hypothetical protein